MASYPSTIESLPTHLLSEVIATAASSSMADLFKLKTCSKYFLKLVKEDDYIYQHVSMENLPYLRKPQLSSFLARCTQSGNLESLYREGMEQYFSTLELDSGLEILKEASQKGHREARYVCGMILLCSEDEDERREGVELLGFLGKCWCVKRCRKKVQGFLKEMWMNNRTLFRNGGAREALCPSQTCRGLQEIARLERGWPVLGEEDEDISCELCKWDYELRQFSEMYG